MSKVKETSNDYASKLIDLVLEGQNPEELVNEAISTIHEQGGPFRAGKELKVLKDSTAKKEDGSEVALKAGDVVSVVEPFAGPTGTDRLVLLPDKKTKAVVALDVVESCDSCGGCEAEEEDGEEEKEEISEQGDADKEEPEDKEKKKDKKKKSKDKEDDEEDDDEDDMEESLEESLEEEPKEEIKEEVIVEKKEEQRNLFEAFDMGKEFK